ncbi:MAG TPA: methylated-DNA--protein-cysteine methyltransferase, partial [Bacteroidales bacterium]|nr:methylated-DNA--protein-cysteine methyltransferase [Bacteroidales bacterium]
MQLESARISSPVGILEISGSNLGIRSILFINEKSEPTAIPVILEDCVKQLNEYFAGTRRNFELLLDPVGTDFQLSVWQQLQTIPFGKTISYL